MSADEKLPNQVKRLRMTRGWSQDELARRAGISRAAVSAIEIQRLVPSVAAALSLAAALNCRVEDLFGAPRAEKDSASWAWSPETEPCRFWEAEVQGRVWRYPAEPGCFGIPVHDGVWGQGQFRQHRACQPDHTLVMASCDPAAALLAAELARTTAFRLLVVPRSSRESLTLLGNGLVHVAGMHLSKAGSKRGNRAVVREQLGPGYNLVHVARWEEGVAIARGETIKTVSEAARTSSRWIGRETGSGARQCLDEILDGRPAPKKLARDHRSVAEAIRCGWADYGVCVRLVAEEARLRFLTVRTETYDLVYRTADADDPRIKALMTVLQSLRYRELLSELPGYDASPLGEVVPESITD